MPEIHNLKSDSNFTRKYVLCFSFWICELGCIFKLLVLNMVFILTLNDTYITQVTAYFPHKYFDYLHKNEPKG